MFWDLHERVPCSCSTPGEPHVVICPAQSIQVLKNTKSASSILQRKLGICDSRLPPIVPDDMLISYPRPLNPLNIHLKSRYILHNPVNQAIKAGRDGKLTLDRIFISSSLSFTHLHKPSSSPIFSRRSYVSFTASTTAFRL